MAIAIGTFTPLGLCLSDETLLRLTTAKLLHVINAQYDGADSTLH